MGGSLQPDECRSLSPHLVFADECGMRPQFFSLVLSLILLDYHFPILLARTFGRTFLSASIGISALLASPSRGLRDILLTDKSQETYCQVIAWVLRSLAKLSSTFQSSCVCVCVHAILILLYHYINMFLIMYINILLLYINPCNEMIFAMK